MTFHLNSGSIIFSLFSADTLQASCGSANQEEFHTLADESEETFHTLREDSQDEFHTLKGIEELEEDHQFSGRGLLSIPTEASQYFTFTVLRIRDVYPGSWFLSL